MVLFELVRDKKDIYLARVRSQPHRVLKTPPPGVFAWIPHILRFSDDEVLESVGMDAFVLLGYIRLLCKITVVCGLCGILILCPVYYSSPGNPGVAGINLYSMGNLEQDGHALWAPFLFTWLFTLYLLYMLHLEYGSFVRNRQQFLRQGDVDHMHPQTTYSVQVENIPVEFRSSEKLFALFDSLFPGEVSFARISVAMSPLARNIDKRNAAVANAECAVAEFMGSDKKESPVIKINSKGKPAGALAYCSKTEEVNAMEYFKGEVVRLNGKISRYQQEARIAENAEVLPPDTPVTDEAAVDDEDDKDDAALQTNLAPKITKKSVTGTGFVTFKSRRVQATCCQVSILSEKYPTLKAFPAPEPKDIVWSNIAVTPQFTKEAENVTTTMYCVGMGFWALVLAFISALSNLNNLKTYLPFIESMDPVLYSLVAGLLPVIFLAVFMSLLPVIMAYVSELIERRKTFSGIQMEVFSW